MGKESSCIAGDSGYMGLIPRLGRSPGGDKWQATPLFLPEKSHGQGSLGSHSLKGHKESDTTEQLSTAWNTDKTLLMAHLDS